MKTVLVLVGEKLSANGICATAVMREMKASGYRVICVTNQEYLTRHGEVEDGIEVERIKPRLTYAMNSWRGQHTGCFAQFVGALSFILNKLKLLICIPSWPLISPAYAWRFYKAAKRIYAKTNFDCIISVYTQIDTIIAGHFIKLLHPEVRFVPYFLDSLSGGYGPKIFSKEWIIKRGLYWERILLKNADKIIVMKSSQKHHDTYNQTTPYYSRIKVLDIPLLYPVDQEIKDDHILDPAYLNFVYVGSIPYHIRNPQYILEIFKNLKLENCRLTIIGTNTCPEVLSKAQKESTRNQIILMRSISHSKIIGVLQNADFLVNIGNNNTSMVPSKVFEYMSAGKPIISTYPIADEPSLPYLRHYPLALSIREDWDHLDQAVTQVADFVESSRGQRVHFDTLKAKMFENTPQAFVMEINLLWP